MTLICGQKGSTIVLKKKSRMGYIMKILALLLMALLASIVIVVVAARTVTYYSNRICTENGVDERIYVTLGGQEQYLLIRGEDVSNPVILWLHGGPAGSDAFVNHLFQKYLVDDYTLINWDQRGCGRTYFRNRKSDPDNESVTFEQAQFDLDELVAYACERFDKDKIIIVGHSYGTMLGSKYVLDNPDKVLAYIGVGQFVDLESDTYSYQDALKKAKAKGDDTSEMEAAYQEYLDNGSLLNLMSVRTYAGKYHVAEKSANTIWAGISSPYMGLDDLRWFTKQIGNLGEYFALNKQLFDSLLITKVRNFGLEYQVPVGFISGADDWTTPVKYSEDYCNLITAPEKKTAWIDGCGHAPQYDDPEAFCKELKGMLKEFVTEELEK